MEKLQKLDHFVLYFESRKNYWYMYTVQKRSISRDFQGTRAVFWNVHAFWLVLYSQISKYVMKAYFRCTTHLNKLTCRPKKRSADKFDSSDPSYCQFLIKL